jgi:hypothetical protein
VLDIDAELSEPRRARPAPRPPGMAGVPESQDADSGQGADE